MSGSLLELVVADNADDTYSAISRSTAEVIVLLPSSVTLHEDATSLIERLFLEDPVLDAAYGDVLVQGTDTSGSEAVAELLRLPDWSPQRLCASDYIQGALAVRRSALDRVAGTAVSRGAAWRHDLLLCGAETGWRVSKIDTVLSTMSSARPGATEENKSVVAEHLRRCGVNADLSLVDGTLRIRRRVAPGTRVAVVVPTRGTRGSVHGEEAIYVVECLRSVAQTLAPHLDVEYIVVADVGDDVGYVDTLADVLGDRLKILWYEGDFDFSRKVNLGIAGTDAQFVAVVNDDMKVISPHWLEQMVSLASDPKVGAVGAMLRFEDGTIQHAGHYYLAGKCAHAYRGTDERAGVLNELLIDREVSGVTGACLVQRREVWAEVGGWSSTFPRNFNDVDFCLKVREVGYDIIQASSVELFHYESKSRNPRVDPAERNHLWGRWFHRMQREPFTLGGLV